MNGLSDKLLLEVYYHALDLKLSPDFINLIKEELTKRDISVKNKLYK